MFNTFESVLVQWGNALVIRIPETIAESVHLRRNERIICTIENGNVEMTSMCKHYTLSELLDGTTEIETEVDWGKPVGAEVW